MDKKAIFMERVLSYSKEKFDFVLLFFLISNIIKRLLFSYLVDEKIELGYCLIVLGTTLLIVSFYFFMGPKLGKMYLLLWSAFFSTILLVNLWHYRYFQFPFSVFEILEVKNLSGLGPSIMEQFRWIDIVFVFDLLTIPFIRTTKRIKDIKNVMKKFGVVFLTGCVFISLKPLKVSATEHLPLKSMFYIMDKTQFVLRWTPLTYTIVDGYNFLTSNSQISLSNNEKTEIKQWFDKHKETYYSNVSKTQYSGIGKGKNLIVIQVESLENFVINNKVGGQEITPNLNRLLKNSLFFTDITPNVKGGNSSDAELLFNTSLYPISDGCTFYRYPFNEYNSLPKILNNLGYNSFASHGDRASFWNRKQAYPSLGFKEFYDISKFNSEDKIGMGLSDESFFKQSVERLKTAKQPFYSFFITLSSHTPFIIPDNLKSLNINKDAGTIGNYLQSIHYTDKAIGEFLDELEKEGLLKNSIVVIYGDHPALGSSYEQEVSQNFKEFGFVKDGRKVPFIIYNPSIKGNTYQHIGSQIDMMPTVADILGIDDNVISESVMGRNLLSSGETAQKSTKENDNDSMLSDLIIRSNYFKQNKLLMTMNK